MGGCEGNGKVANLRGRGRVDGREGYFLLLTSAVWPMAINPESRRDGAGGSVRQFVFARYWAKHVSLGGYDYSFLSLVGDGFFFRGVFLHRVF